MQKLGAILTVLAASGIASAQTPGFWLVGHAPGATNTQVLALSADGGIAAGGSSRIGFAWTRQNGRYDFGLEPGMPAVSVAYGLSNDGETIAGQMSPDPNNNQLSRAYRRVGNGPLVDLGLITGNTRAYARGISGDGNTVVGACESGQLTSVFGQAFRWTPQGGMQGLGYTRPVSFFSVALGISRDGSTIVGESEPNGYADAFVWRQSTGMQALPRLPGSPPEQAAQANAANADGSVIVGSSYDPVTVQPMAVRWTAAGVEPLGTVPGYRRSHSFAVDGTGSLIAGDIFSSQIGLPDTAFVWTPLTGMRTISEYLSGYGVAVPAGYRVGHVAAMSDDGQTFAGYTINLSTGRQEGFVATVPGPGSGVVVLLGVMMGWRRRRG